jgi:hypothetical protein
MWLYLPVVHWRFHDSIGSILYNIYLKTYWSLFMIVKVRVKIRNQNMQNAKRSSGDVIPNRPLHAFVTVNCSMYQ